MPSQKYPTINKASRKKPKVTVGIEEEEEQISTWSRPKILLIAAFALLFGVIGFYLHKNSFAGTSTTVTVATWNAMKDNEKNTAVQVKSILKKANVVGLQEEHTAAQRNNIRKLIEGNKYAVSPKAKAENDSAAGVESNAIVWREKEFTRLSEGTSDQVSPALPGLRPRYITWVKLKQNATGKQFYIVNTHMVRDVEQNGLLTNKTANTNAYAVHMQKLVELVKQFQRDNVPIFLTGDFAVNYRLDSGGVNVFPKVSLGAIGMKSNWELTNMKGIALKAKTYKNSSRLIDYVFAWNAAPVSTSIGSKYGSDHYVVYFKVSLFPSTTIDTR